MRSGQPGINASEYSEYSFPVPSLPEQHKIASLLSSVDETLALCRRKLDLLTQAKKALMQQIFSQQLRFKADDGSDFPDWEEKKLGDIVSRITRRNNGRSDIPLTISSIEGLVDQRTYFNKTIASKDLSNYLLIKHGEFAYNKSYSVGFPFGSIQRLEKFDQGALSTLYICFAINSDSAVNSDFFKYFWESQNWVSEVAAISAEGARNHGLLNIATSDFFNIHIILPSSLLEQQKIASCLSSADALVDQARVELEQWKEVKKSLLQQLFV